ncbi:hypothetical protein KL906_003616 [Ogataea polymorpha]|uniref:uncharacterized protein n=1 Tax=Ogataea polymorpha TaxID=460523 RepID=UPI0007F43C30|nr:uncharacterized protein OGAPODRAFT_10387 [Ogataea polymorpha]KAG7907535.1 hypothetical protein KL906_003616 [Ogataea polymorpha]KAG7932967.1 hypothetical protein KL934_003622 [Ogataea polymorpha]OBA13722.1 hypothetical protein OGAPODRAFT_10387 [Ogataea polymorpha]
MRIIRRDDFEDLLGGNFDAATEFKQYKEPSYLEEAVAAENATESLKKSSFFSKLAQPLKYTFEKKDFVILVFLIACFVTLLAVFCGAVYFGYREYSLLLRRVNLYEKDVTSCDDDEELDEESKPRSAYSGATLREASNRASAFSPGPARNLAKASLAFPDAEQHTPAVTRTLNSWKDSLHKISKRGTPKGVPGKPSASTQFSAPIDGGYMPTWSSMIDSKLSPIDVVHGSVSPDAVKNTATSEAAPETSCLVNDDRSLVEQSADNTRFMSIYEQYSPEADGHLEHEPKRVYTMVQLYELEPLDLIQEFVDGDDNKLLATDILFPKKPLYSESSVVEIEKELTMIRLNLFNCSLDTASKVLEIIKFLANSFGLQKFNNPRIFLMSYGMLIEQLVESDFIINDNEIPTILVGAFIEIVVKYSVCCWKYPASRHLKVDRKFAAWKMTPHVPPQYKVFKYICTLIKSGYKTDLLGEVLIFFSTPPTPHNLIYLLPESELENYKNPEVLELMAYLREQIQEEHSDCCGSTSFLGATSPAYSEYEAFLQSRVPRKPTSPRRALPGAFARETNNLDTAREPL